MRSQLAAMNRWGTDDSAPPESNYPRISDGDLVLPQQLAFPRLPGMGQPADPHKASWVDYGPEFSPPSVPQARGRPLYSTLSNLRFRTLPVVSSNPSTRPRSSRVNW